MSGKENIAEPKPGLAIGSNQVSETKPVSSHSLAATCFTGAVLGVTLFSTVDTTATSLYGTLFSVAFAVLVFLWWVSTLPSQRLTRFIRAHFKTVACCTVAGLLCFSVAHSSLHQRLVQQLPERVIGNDFSVVGHVYDIPQRESHATRFILQVRSACQQVVNEDKKSCLHAPFAGKKFRLTWRNAEPMRSGELWQFTLRLRPPRGLVNPGGFDYHAWLLGQDIAGVGYVKSDASFVDEASREELSIGEKEISPRGVDTIIVALNRLRGKIASRVFVDNQDAIRHQAVFRALLLGDKRDMGPNHWRVFQATGTSHLMAISGLHVGLVAGLSYFLANLLLRLVHSPLAVLSRRFSVNVECNRLYQLLPLYFALCVAVFYAGLAGFSIPTQRALIFFALLCVSKTLGRQTSMLSLLLFTAALVVLLDPFSLFQKGFYLSFAAVLVLICVFSGRVNQASKFRQFVRAQWVLFIGLMAPLLLLRLPISFVSPFVNCIAVPLISLLVLPLLFFGLCLYPISVQISTWVFALADTIFSGLWHVLAFAAQLNWQWTYRLNDNAISTLLGMVILLILLLPAQFRLRWLAAVLAIVALWPAAKEDGEFKMTSLDVGQGLAIVMQAGGNTMIYDTGAHYSERFNIGSHVLSPFLQQQGVEEIQTVFVSHGDNDHAGGLSGLLAHYQAKNIVAGQADLMREQLKDKSSATISECNAGKIWQLEHVRIESLWPVSEPWARDLRANNRSCVLLLHIGERKILLMGDVEAKVERELIKRQRLPTHVAVLVAAHHGSSSSSSAAFLKSVQAEHVIFSAGHKNRYGHPHPAVVERFEQASSTLHRTADHGAVTVTFPLHSEDAFRVEHERAVQGRPWHASWPDSG